MPSPFDNLLPRYDAVVIGAGLGGMTAANNLAKFGRKVLLLEHHYQLGGLATFFKRAGTPALRKYFCAMTSVATWLQVAGTSILSCEKTTEPSGLRISLLPLRNSMPA
jgi:heterodisulfide reductase subunit A-like polyferredoxin